MSRSSAFSSLWHQVRHDAVESTSITASAAKLLVFPTSTVTNSFLYFDSIFWICLIRQLALFSAKKTGENKDALGS